MMEYFLVPEFIIVILLSGPLISIIMFSLWNDDDYD